MLSDSVLYAESVSSVSLLNVLPFVLFGSCTIILDCFVDFVWHECLLSAVPFFMLLIVFSIFSFDFSVDFILPLGFVAGLVKWCLAAIMNLAIFI